MSIALGCVGEVGTEAGAASETASPSVPIDTPASGVTATGEELTLGSRGERVEQLYRYLARYGYFPNAELEAKYPGFKSIIGQTPADTSLYDSTLAEAVLAYQRNMGIEATGIADEETLAIMAQARCEWPDGYEGSAEHAAHELDENGLIEKFHTSGARRELTWSIESYPSSIGRATFTSLAQEMVNEWKTVYPSNFTNVAAGTGQVKVSFTAIDGRSKQYNADRTCNINVTNHGCVLGDSTLRIDKDEPWEFTGTPTFPEADFRSVFLHEFGHNIGMNHSSDSGSVMYATSTRGTTFRKLNGDDRAAVRSSFAVWGAVNTPALVTDVSMLAQAYIITNEATSGGFKIYRYGNGAWTNIPGGAVRIASDWRGRAWIVNNVGNIYYRAENDSAWRQVTGCGRDIGVSLGGPISIVGCNGGIFVGKMDPNQADSVLDTQRNAGFQRLEPAWPVSPAPSFVNVSGGFGTMTDGGVVLTASDTLGRVWISLGNGLFAGALDQPIPVFDVAMAEKQIWATKAQNGSAVGAYVANINSARTNTTALSRWKGYDTLDAVRIAVAVNGRPYVVGRDGRLRTTSK